MPAAGAITAGVAAAVKLGFGIYQMHKGAQMERRNKRPKYEIPQAIKEKMSTADLMQYQGLPEAQKQSYLDNIDRSTTYSLGQLGTRKSGLAGVTTLSQQNIDSDKNLLAMDAAQRTQNIGALQGARSEEAQFQDQQFSFNKAQPFYDKKGQSEALKGAGMQNVVGGLDAAATGVADYAVNKKKATTTTTTPGQGTAD